MRSLVGDRKVLIFLWSKALRNGGSIDYRGQAVNEYAVEWCCQTLKPRQTCSAVSKLFQCQDPSHIKKASLESLDFDDTSNRWHY